MQEKFSNGDVYEGDWIDDLKTGKGTYKLDFMQEKNKNISELNST